MKIFSVLDKIKCLCLSNPGRLQGGSYFTKIHVNNEPLYVTLENVFTNGDLYEKDSRFFLDLSLEDTHQDSIQWFLELENQVRSVILKKSELWFNTKMETIDIEHLFESCLSNAKYNIQLRSELLYKKNKLCCSIFDENKVPTPIETIRNQTISCILHVKGVHLSNTCFTLQLEMKQILCMENDTIFNECLLNTNTNTDASNIDFQFHKNDIENPIQSIVPYEKNISSNETNNNIYKNTSNDFVENKNEKVVNQGELQEYSIPIDTISDNKSIQLKKTREIFEHEYNDAKMKAKISRAEAIRNYIEMEKIKEKYMISSSESESENDSDVGSEIELIST